MTDEFTSVQWDRDEAPPQPIASEIHGLFDEEDETDNGDQKLSSVQQASIGKSNVSYSDESTDFYINTTVSEPLKETDGSNHFITYLLRTKTNDPTFKSQEFQIRRRFSDFNFLYQSLLNEFPLVIVPSLPNKQRLEYIKGDRFSEYFTTKRSISLNNFLSRISKHELLRNSKVYHSFLENSDYWVSFKGSSKLNGSTTTSSSDTNEKISDYIMNAFKKPTIHTENTKEFQEIVTKSNKLQENLVKIDRVYSKVIKKQNDLSTNFVKFGDELTKLNRLINDNTEEETSDLDQLLVKNFKALSNNLRKVSSESDQLTLQIDYEYLTSLKDLEHYIALLKNAFKLKDSKLIDYEALTSYLNKAINEKEALLHNGSASTTEATLKFLTKKLESITGSDVAGGSTNSTNNKILKLNSKITKLEQESQSALEIFENFEKQLLQEYYTKFEPIKTEEINESLNKLAKLNMNFYDTVLKNWENLDDSLVKNKRELPTSKLNENENENTKFYKNDEIIKNEQTIKRDFDELVKTRDLKLQKLRELQQLQQLQQPLQDTLQDTLQDVPEDTSEVEDNPLMNVMNGDIYDYSEDESY